MSKSYRYTPDNNKAEQSAKKQAKQSAKVLGRKEKNILRQLGNADEKG